MSNRSYDIVSSFFIFKQFKSLFKYYKPLCRHYHYWKYSSRLGDHIKVSQFSRQSTPLIKHASPFLKPCYKYNYIHNEAVPFHIADPQAFLNAIASGYTSTERIAIEYVDNAVDDIDRSVSPDFVVKVYLDIDINRKTLWVRDNCRGMNYEDLCRIISGVGKVFFLTFIIFF